MHYLREDASLKGMKALMIPFFLAFALNLFVSVPTYRTFGIYTDHLSHMMSVFLFAERGFEIHRRDIKELCPIRASPEIAAFNEQWSIPKMDLLNTCQTMPGGRVLFINWPHMARPYPIGDLLWYAPAAGLYAMTGNLPGVAQFMIWQMLLIAGLGMVIFLNGAFMGIRERRFEKGVWAALAGITLSTTALMGFYDGVSFWLVCGSILLALDSQEKRWLPRAVLLFAGACFFHYRAIWYAPILVYLLHRWRRENPHFWRTPAFVVSAVLLVATVLTLMACLPSIRSLPTENPFMLYPGKVWLHIGPLALLNLFIFWRDRNLLGMAVLSSCLFFSATTPLAQRWYILFWLPLLLVTLREGRGHRSFWACAVLLFVLDQKIYDLSIFAGGALPTLTYEFIAGFLI